MNKFFNGYTIWRHLGCIMLWQIEFHLIYQATAFSSVSGQFHALTGKTNIIPLPLASCRHLLPCTIKRTRSVRFERSGVASHTCDWRIRVVFDNDHPNLHLIVRILWPRDFPHRLIEFIDSNKNSKISCRSLETLTFTETHAENCKGKIHAILPLNRVLFDIHKHPDSFLHEYQILLPAVVQGHTDEKFCPFQFLTSLLADKSTTNYRTSCIGSDATPLHLPHPVYHESCNADFVSINTMICGSACAEIREQLRSVRQKDRCIRGHEISSKTHMLLRKQIIGEVREWPGMVVSRFLPAADVSNSLSLDFCSLHAPGLEIADFSTDLTSSTNGISMADASILPKNNKQNTSIRAILFSNLNWNTGDRGSIRLMQKSSNLTARNSDTILSLRTFGDKPEGINVPPLYDASGFDAEFDRFYGQRSRISFSALATKNVVDTINCCHVSSEFLIYLFPNCLISNTTGLSEDPVLHSPPSSASFSTVNANKQDFHSYRLDIPDSPAFASQAGPHRNSTHDVSVSSALARKFGNGNSFGLRLPLASYIRICKTAFVQTIDRKAATGKMYRVSGNAPQYTRLTAIKRMGHNENTAAAWAPASTNSDPSGYGLNCALNNSNEIHELPDEVIEENLRSIRDNATANEICQMLRCGKLGKELGDIFTKVENEHNEINKISGFVDDAGISNITELLQNTPEEVQAAGKEVFGDAAELSSDEKGMLDHVTLGAPKINTQADFVTHGKAFAKEYYKQRGFRDPGLKRGYTAAGGIFHWKESLTKLELWVPVMKSAGPRDIKFSCKTSYLLVAERQQSGIFKTLLEGQLFGKVSADDCHWVLNGDFRGDEVFVQVNHSTIGNLC